MRPPRPISEGWLLLAPLALATLAARGRPLLAAGLATAAAVVAAGLRDPERVPTPGDHALAPADGRVVRVARVRDAHFEQEMLEIAVFLALWNVHVQRAPLDGRLIAIERFAGKYGNALFEGSEQNFRQSMYFDTGWGPCTVTQVAGMVARRIVRWVEPGDRIEAGGRLGMIKFGSRVVLHVPAICEPLVSVGQEIRAGRTPVARRPH